MGSVLPNKVIAEVNFKTFLENFQFQNHGSWLIHSSQREQSSVEGGGIPGDVRHDHVCNLRSFVLCTRMVHFSCCSRHMVVIKTYNQLACILKVCVCKDGSGLNHVICRFNKYLLAVLVVSKCGDRWGSGYLLSWNKSFINCLLMSAHHSSFTKCMGSLWAQILLNQQIWHHT